MKIQETPVSTALVISKKQIMFLQLHITKYVFRKTHKIRPVAKIILAELDSAMMVHFASDGVCACRGAGSSGFGFAGGKVVGSGRKASTVVVAFVSLVDVPESSISLEMFVVFEHHGFVRAIEVRIVVCICRCYC